MLTRGQHVPHFGDRGFLIMTGQLSWFPSHTQSLLQLVSLVKQYIAVLIKASSPASNLITPYWLSYNKITVHVLFIFTSVQDNG